MSKDDGISDAVRYLTRRGWQIHRTYKRQSYVGGKPIPVPNDVFSALNLIAIHPEHGFLWVKVKPDNETEKIRKAIRRLAEVRWPHSGNGYRVQVWAAGKQGGRRGFWVYHFSPHKTTLPRIGEPIEPNGFLKMYSPVPDGMTIANARQ